jgi:hypothetical protein
LEPVTLGPALAVHADGSRREKALGLGAGTDVGERGDDAVEPLAGSLR